MESQIEKTLDELLPRTGQTAEAARYAVFNGGKRLRPRIVCDIAQTLGASLDQALTPAAAIECLHTYSLIHDDLPCMDNDDIRRGRPTVHKAFSEGIALLAGDFLLTFSFQLLSESPSLSSDQKLSLIQTLSTAAGVAGMIGGQELDIKASSWDELSLAYRGKTGALFAAAFAFGGIIANAPSLDLLHDMGYAFGLAFQLRDDLADNDGAAALLGRLEVERLIAVEELKFGELLNLLPSRPALFAV